MDTTRDESRATERPWQISRFTGTDALILTNDGEIGISDANREPVARVRRRAECKRGQATTAPDAERDANAALIVAAVNQHAALLACREALAVALDDMTLLMTGLCPRDLVDEIHARFITSRAALAASQPKAEG